VTFPSFLSFLLSQNSFSLPSYFLHLPFFSSPVMSINFLGIAESGRALWGPTTGPGRARPTNGFWRSLSWNSRCYYYRSFFLRHTGMALLRKEVAVWFPADIPSRTVPLPALVGTSLILRKISKPEFRNIPLGCRKVTPAQNEVSLPLPVFVDAPDPDIQHNHCITKYMYKWLFQDYNL